MTCPQVNDKSYAKKGVKGVKKTPPPPTPPTRVKVKEETSFRNLSFTFIYTRDHRKPPCIDIDMTLQLHANYSFIQADVFR